MKQKLPKTFLRLRNIYINSELILNPSLAREGLTGKIDITFFYADRTINKKFYNENKSLSLQERD